MKISRFIGKAAILVILCSIALAAEDFMVEQKDKNFVYKGAKADMLKLKVGDAIQFKNMDPYFHNVFSLSDAKMFDLGSYPQGQSKSVTFDQPGKIDVECAIHPQMKMTVEVK
ncbi:MAG TPA: plastocyanin/azurin family copper-binding protein [Terriglobales bacterium]|jgi:plastocyanin|nr:plastocyanin/azurin family copper-binding protein [Terriglobales bacterium]